MGGVVQCLFLALAHKEHFLLSQRMRKEPEKGKPAPSWVTAHIEGSWTTKISRKSLFLLLLSLQAHTSPKAALLPSAGSLESRRAGPSMAILQHWPQGSSRLGKHLLQPAELSCQGVCFHHLQPCLFHCLFRFLHYYFFTLKSKCDAFKEVHLCSQAGRTPL